MFNIFNMINPNANITPYLNDLQNFSNNTVHKVLQVFINSFGSADIFFGLLSFFVVGGYYLNSEGNKLITLAVLLMLMIIGIAGILFSSIISIIFTIIIAFLITNLFIKIFFGDR